MGCNPTSWWRHQMETFSALLAICAGNSPVSGEFPAQRPVTRSFDVFFDVRLIKRLSKHSRGWWFETLSYPLWRHRNVYLLWSQIKCVIVSSIDPFYWYGLILIPAWISMPSKVWDEITYPILNVSGATVDVWEWISNFIPHIMISNI